MSATERSRSGCCEPTLPPAPPAVSSGCSTNYVSDATDNDLQPMTSASDDEILRCCVCRHLVDDPVQLRCLHHCCRSCLGAASAAAEDGSVEYVVCPKCNEVTDARAAKSNAFLAARVSKYEVLNEGRACTNCQRNDKDDRPAEVWCPTCQLSLCHDCRKSHSQFLSKHATTPLEAVKSYEDLCERVPFKCAEHGHPANIVCLTCCASKCDLCRRRCIENNHMAQQAQHTIIEGHASKVKQQIFERRTELRSKLTLLSERRLQEDVRNARDYHCKQIQGKKKLIIETVEKVCTEGERTLCDLCDIIELRAVELSSFNSKVTQALTYSDFVLATKSVHDLIHQQQQLTERLHELSAEMDAWTTLQNAAAMIAVPSAMPSNLKELVTALFGMPALSKGDNNVMFLKSQPEVATAVVDPTVDQCSQEVKPNLVRQGHASNEESNAFEAVLHCRDLAVTCDGNVLVGTCSEGLVEYSDRGKRLSFWKPPVLSDGTLETVQTVEALPERGAIVGLYNSKILALLDYSESSDDRWSEKGRIDCLLYHPLHLSVHGSVIAVAESAGREQLLLVSLDSRQQLSRQKRDYNIEGVAVTAQAVVTASDKLRDGSSVIEAYPHEGGGRLWRHSTDVGIIVRDLCTAAAAGCLLYIAEARNSEGRISDVAIIGTDGRGVRECGKVSFSCEKQCQLWQWKPRRLSTVSSERDRLQLAVLCDNDHVSTFPVLLTTST